MWIGKQKDMLPYLFPDQAEYYYGEDMTNPQIFSTDVYSNGDEHTY